MLLILWTIALLHAVSGQAEDYCYAQDTDPYILLSEATAYEFIHNKDANPVSIDQCQPVQFWMLARHGTRFPTPDMLIRLGVLSDLRDKIIENHEEMQKGRLCAQDLENLKKWTLQGVSTLAGELSIQGYYDHRGLAERYKSRFPTLFNQSFSKDKFEEHVLRNYPVQRYVVDVDEGMVLFQFRFDIKERTGASAFSFSDGMFGTTSGVYFPEPLEEEMLIYSYKSCNKWQEDVDDNKNTTAEQEQFDEGPFMTTLIQTVSQRLGFDDLLDVANIVAMYDSCRFDKAQHLTETSPWCAVFSEDELQVLEYRLDLLEYYNAGYGNDLNLKVGCPPVKDFLDRFSEIENGGQQPVGVFYFSHDTMLEMVMSVLGIAKDTEPLTHSNYEEMKSRQWKLSILDPFTANLVAVFFQCDTGEPYRVQFYLNEYPLDIEGCDQGLCDWSYIQDLYGSISVDCNLDFC